MSGCVNCVWDQYRDELEEWADKRREASLRLQRQGRRSGRTGRGGGESREGDGEAPAHVAVSMDDDGGGSETNWDPGVAMGGGAPGLNLARGGDLFEGIPIGIREFMRTEKRLKEKRAGLVT